MCEHKNSREMLAAAAIFATGVGVLCFLKNKRVICKKLRSLGHPLGHRCIEVVDNPDDCQRIVNNLKKDCNKYSVLGFDCEWVTVGGKRRPTALLQLCSSSGLCALFRLSSMQQIPQSLRELLEDDNVIKVGVGSHDDAQKLSNDYGVGVASTLDLRFIAALSGNKPEGLAKMSKSHLGVELDKNWRLACSDWDARQLNDKQKNYAANDALVAVELFKKLTDKMDPKPFWQRKPTLNKLLEQLEPFYDVKFKDSLGRNLNKNKNKDKKPKDNKNNKNKNKKDDADAETSSMRSGGDDDEGGGGGGSRRGIKCGMKTLSKQQTRAMSTRSKCFYDNSLLQAPDGELLCTIDQKKAQWYIDQNLGIEIQSDPFTVRLNFEPAGRAVGEVGRYYQTAKANQCVVCGRTDAYIRKNVVPREYRKHFPIVMKSHTSHDILLLCLNCHQISNISDIKIRRELAHKCDAPIASEEGANKVFEVPGLRNLRSAARALLKSGHKIPEERKEALQQIVIDYYGIETEITNDLLDLAANTDITVHNENYCQHGEKVVQRFNKDFGGLLELERLWREHFLHTMRPQFLPALWNVNHNANRLEIRANEGRVAEEDLIAAGLQIQPVNDEKKTK